RTGFAPRRRTRAASRVPAHRAPADRTGLPPPKRRLNCEPRRESLGVLGADPAGIDRVEQVLVVAQVLLNVVGGEGADRPIEAVSGAKVGSDRKAIAGAGVGAGQRPAADPRVDLEPRRRKPLDFGRALPVPELPHVEVALVAIEPDRSAPAE